jgi:hypothetical protein
LVGGAIVDVGGDIQVRARIGRQRRSARSLGRPDRR